MLLTLTPVVLWLASWPFADVGFNDDFSYAFTVKRFVETGQFTYNAWSSAMLGAQVLWAWPFVKMLGFSHDALRISMLPLSVACAWLTYGLHRRLDISPAWSLFATLLLVSSPLFTPWSASFMTDVPGLLLTLALIHGAVSLRRATDTPGILRWALFVAVIGLLGGSVRQTNFVLTLVVFLVELMHRRKQTAELATLGALGAAYLGGMVGIVTWHASQPYNLPEMTPGPSMLPRAVLNLFKLGMDAGLFLLPLTLALTQWRRVRSGGAWVTMIVIAASVLLLCAVFPEAKRDELLAPWTGNTVTPTGILEDTINAPGHRPTILPVGARAAMTWVTWTSLAAIAGTLWIRRAAILNVVRRLHQIPTTPGAGVLFVLLCLAATYTTLLVPRASFGMIFDRYLLVLFPIATILVLRVGRAVLRPAPASAGWVALVLFAAVGSALTFDHFSEARARDQMAASLMKRGVPRTNIVNGLVFDAWTQLEARGYLNDLRLKNPNGSYVSSPDDARREAIFWLLSRTPAIEPKWVIQNRRVSDGLPALGPVARFRTIFPPNQRWIAAFPVNLPPTTGPSDPP